MRNLLLLTLLCFYSLTIKSQDKSKNDSIADIIQTKLIIDAIQKTEVKLDSSIKSIDSTLTKKIKTIQFSLDSVKSAIQKNGGTELGGRIIISKKPVNIGYSTSIKRHVFKKYLKNKYYYNPLRDNKKEFNTKSLAGERKVLKAELKSKKNNIKLDWSHRKFRSRNFNYKIITGDIGFFNDHIKNKEFKLPNPLDETSKPILSIKKRYILWRRLKVPQVKSGSIEDVTFAVNEDRIQNLSVNIQGKKTFVAGQAPIPFYSLKKSGRKDRLRNQDGESLYFNEIIKDYLPLDYRYQVYLSKTYSPKKAGDTLKLYITSDINRFINFAIYSDLPSLVGNNSNGVVEMKFDGSTIINRRNFHNSRSYFGRDISGNLKFSKIDGELSVIESKQKTVINSTETKTLVTPRILDIYQRAYLGGGIKISLLKDYFNYDNYWHISIGGGYNNANFRDLDSTSKDIGVFSGMIQAGLYLRPHKAFGSTFNISVSRMNFREVDNVFNQGATQVGNIGINFFWTPDNEISKVFINMEYTSDLNSRDDFALFQVGYKANLIKLFPKK